jgi:tRNA(adenine34) deaminase
MAGERDIYFLRLAIEQAQKGLDTPGGAEVGAVLVKDERVACAGFNEGDLQHDPTAHAEMVAIRRFCASMKTTKLEGYTLYCTLQPCGMCTMACLWVGISRIVYGAGREDVNSVCFESRHFDTADFIRQVFRDDLQVEGGLLAEECSAFYASKGDSVGEDTAHERTLPAD